MNNFTLDDEQIRRLFENLSQKNRKNSFKSAIRKGLNIVKKRATTNLKNVINGPINTIDKYGSSLLKGIKTKAFRNGHGGMIHILGNYKLKFFEMGTNPRYAKTYRGKLLKKPRYTGQIRASHFFKSAVQESESEVFNSLDRLIKESILRLANKK